MKKRRLFLFAVTLALTAVFASCKKDPDTSKAADSWIKIYTAVDLDAVRDSLSGNYILMNDISLADYSPGEGWEPIGTADTPFTGKFNGNGHKITDLAINRSDEWYVGLFGYISGGSVSDLGVEIAAGGVNGGSSYVGGIAGSVTGNSTIANCYSMGDISSSAYAGGISGYADDRSTITGCYSMGNISGSSSGGIAGYVNSSGTITDCYSTGSISGGTCGGVVGHMGSNSIITDCHSTGSVSSGGDSGGIAGYTYGCSITDCYSTGDISSSYAAGTSGGIAGTVGDGSIITDCYSAGNIVATFSGGISGYVSNATITNCCSTGNISSYQDGFSGGIAGTIDDGGKITDCYSVGDISVYYDGYSGGIAGDVYVATIMNCYSTGNTATFAMAVVNTASGGIAGRADSGTIINCAAINSTINADYVGRVIGYIYSSVGYTAVSNNFALDAMTATGTGQFDTSNPRFYGISKTNAQLQTQSTYSDPVNGDGLGGLCWKFGNDDANPWKMPAGGGYPILYWQK